MQASALPINAKVGNKQPVSLKSHLLLLKCNITHSIIIRNALIFLRLAGPEHPGLPGADVLGLPRALLLSGHAQNASHRDAGGG